MSLDRVPGKLLRLVSSGGPVLGRAGSAGPVLREGLCHVLRVGVHIGTPRLRTTSLLTAACGRVAFSTVSIVEAQMNEGMRQRIPWKAAIRPLLGLVICIAMAPSIALGVPIDEYGPGVADPFADPTATFTFAVPDPVPGKLSGGGWGALFLKFDKTISSATFVTDPVLASCRDNPMVFGAGTKQLSIGCNTASGAYLFNNQTARDLRMTVTVTSDDPGPIHLIFERNSPSDGTFWAQKRLKVTGGPASGQATNVNPLLENATLDGTLPITLIPNAPSKGISVTCQISNGNVDNAGECLTSKACRQDVSWPFSRLRLIS